MPAVEAHSIELDIEAHRGGRALRPENTLASFANALSMGVNTLELDMGVTRDDVIVVTHDRRLNPDLARGPDGAYVAAPGIPFVNLTLAEVSNTTSDGSAPAVLMRRNFRIRCRSRVPAFRRSPKSSRWCVAQVMRTCD